ncbi:MAG: hypothetical protein Ct9H300mP16_09190 [Pseudomonadota bacterium]|nr:MAG: hypothetical protein Ct9H300mP16_09190 [Pseudomonadota bacterium]
MMGGGLISPTPGVEQRIRAMLSSTLFPGNSPPSLASPLGNFDLQFVRVGKGTRRSHQIDQSTCLIAERFEPPFGSSLNRSEDSPPPRCCFCRQVDSSQCQRFMGLTGDEPRLMAPVQNRLTISLAGSTSASDRDPVPVFSFITHGGYSAQSLRR